MPPLIRVPAEVLDVARALRDAGFEAVVVGGAVRDALLGRAPKDWDLATSATPSEALWVFPRASDTTRFGTTLVPVGGGMVEVTTYRAEGNYTDYRRPSEVRFGTSLLEDLARRDLTINAIAYDPLSDSLVDPFGGADDLARGMLRAVGDADARFGEDALRLLRTVRFVAQLGFRIEPGSAAAIARNAHLVRHLAAERVGMELLKLVDAPWAAEGLQTLAELGLGPALGAVGHDRRTLHIGAAALRLASGGGQVGGLALALGASGSAAAVRATLLELGLGASLADAVAARLEVAALVPEFDASDARLVGLLRRYDDDSVADGLALRVTFDLAAGRDAAASRTWQQRVLDFLDSGLPRRLSELAVSGDDLIRMGVRPGPQLGALLEALLLAVAAGQVANLRSPLLEAARHMAA